MNRGVASPCGLIFSFALGAVHRDPGWVLFGGGIFGQVDTLRRSYSKLL